MPEILSCGRYLLRGLFKLSLKSNVHTALTRQNNTEIWCINSHAQDTTALQPNVFLTGLHRLLVTNKRLSTSFTSNYCHDQLQGTRPLSLGSLLRNPSAPKHVVVICNLLERSGLNKELKARFPPTVCFFILFNPLKTKRRPFYSKTQSVPRCKHFSSRL